MGRWHREVPWQFESWVETEVLHVAAPYTNPFRWKTRRKSFQDFMYHMKQCPNIVLHVGELAFGDRPFEVTGQDENDIQLRTDHELFYKENIGNVIVSHFPKDWKYGAMVDGDFHFTRHDVGLETIHMLQHHDFVQMFSAYADMSARGYGGVRPIRVSGSFAANYMARGCKLPEGFDGGGWKTKLKDYYERAKVWTPVGATGGAWAFRKSAFNTVGRFLDTCILGHGDWFMAFGLVATEAPDVALSKYSDGYRHSIDMWQRNAARLKQNIGVVDCFATHAFHGSKTKREYGTRFQILIDNKFDPYTDLRMDHQGIWILNDEKPRLRDEIRNYFRQREEDDPNLYSPEKHLA